MISTYKNKEDLWRLNKEPYSNEVVYVEEEDVYLVWSNNDWQDYDNFAKDLKMVNTGISFYDMNKQLVSQLNPLSPEDIATKFKLVNEFIVTENNTFYMLYGKEINYFTVFQKTKNNSENFFDIFVECLNNLGNIYSIEKTEDGAAIEIWIKAEPVGTTVLYLFAYDGAIVPFGG